MEDKSVLEEVLEERNKELTMFDYIIDSDNEFNLILAIMPDEFIIKLYEYLAKLERRESFLMDEDDINERLFLLRDRMAALERLDIIIKHNEKYLDESTKKEVNDGVKTVVEKQKVRKMGPLRRYFYNKHKKQS